MKWNKASESTPSQGERVLLAIAYEECPVVGYWGEGEYEACTVNMDVDCCAFCYGGMVDRAFKSSDVTHWMQIPEVPNEQEDS